MSEEKNGVTSISFPVQREIVPRGEVTDADILSVIVAFYRQSMMQFYATNEAWDKMPEAVKEKFMLKEDK